MKKERLARYCGKHSTGSRWEDEPQCDHRSKLPPPTYKFQKILMVALADRHRPPTAKTATFGNARSFCATTAYHRPQSSSASRGHCGKHGTRSNCNTNRTAICLIDVATASSVD
jgi:hypothetical protein